ncbi:HAD family hydrolase [Streptacidiphilus anmyonensis]|uniref:HAD family hydrolase n=1 Tax=Streptacidiphilus anmyonensis TaxID=405782 RepID=UPI0005A61281|nr:HAD-IA family hydrolase [Streptacidiphilus anmyonensis]
MTGASPSLSDLLRRARHILLDFDGPVCSVFAGLPAAEIAERVRGQLLAQGEQLPTQWSTEKDPLALLRYVADTRSDLVPGVDAALTALEIEAVGLSQPTPGSRELLLACADSGRSVSMVSNNSGAAITAFLAAQGLNGYVAGVFGRVPGDPSSMKPSPRLLLEAMEAEATKPEQCIFIGDAARDVEAGEAAGVATIGYANKPGKDVRLADSGAAAVVYSMRTIADAVT